MIDIIIPVYNSRCTLIKTLFSLSIQTIIDKAVIYLIDDCSDENYDDIIELFKDRITIKYMKLKKNIGPGAARKYALTKTDGEYITFIDADDQLYAPNSLEILYKTIVNNQSDMVYGNEIIDGHGFHQDNTGSLHGKIYRRSFLEKNKITFNDTRFSEDDSFNKLAMYTSKKLDFIDNIVYLYMDNPDSITSVLKKNKMKIPMYVENAIWLVEELEKRKVDKKIIAEAFIKSYMYVFKKVYFDNINIYNTVFYNYTKFDDIYLKYRDFVTKDEIISYIRKSANYGAEPDEQVYQDFERYRINFQKFNNQIDIVIPILDENKNLERTFISLVTQIIMNKVNILILKKKNIKQYDELIEKYKSFLNIDIYDLPDDCLTGTANQFGMNHGKGEYILFMRPGDSFLNGLSLKDMYSEILFGKYDAIFVKSFNDSINMYQDDSLIYNNCYGKLYKKSFIKDKNIEFLDIDFYDEFIFNKIVQLTGNIHETGEPMYIHIESSNENGFEEEYSKMIDELIDYCKKLELHDEAMYVILEQLFYNYVNYILLGLNDKKEQILLKCKVLKQYYLYYWNIVEYDKLVEYVNTLLDKSIKRCGTLIYLNSTITFKNFIDLIE